jgi:hypothetical protein
MPKPVVYQYPPEVLQLAWREKQLPFRALVCVPQMWLDGCFLCPSIAQYSLGQWTSGKPTITGVLIA